MQAINSFLQWFHYRFPNFNSSVIEFPFGKLISMEEKKIGFLFIEIDLFQENFLNDLLNLIKEYNQYNIQLVCIWEDVWIVRQELIKERINALLGNSIRIHGRATKIKKLNKPEFDQFIEQNHLQVSTSAKFKFGLFFKDKLVAVASFSGGTPMPKRGLNYRSYELIRFASLSGYTIVGGLSKLIKHFIKEIEPSDIMTYADRDWSVGKSYEKLGFKFEGYTEPQFFWLKKDEWKRYYPTRLPEEVSLKENEFLKVYNTGNLKYRLMVKDGE